MARTSVETSYSMPITTCSGLRPDLEAKSSAQLLDGGWLTLQDCLCWDAIGEAGGKHYESAGWIFNEAARLTCRRGEGLIENTNLPVSSSCERNNEARFADSCFRPSENFVSTSFHQFLPP